MQENTFSPDVFLKNLNIEQLNAMQSESLEANREHRNILLLSQTGSGKTLAFLLPILERLNASQKQTQALVIAPTRELALQIEKVFKQLGTGFKITCCYGGHLRETEENNLIQAPALIVGTPGRLCDHIRRGNIRTEAISFLAIDEFDKCLEFGFSEEVQFIVESLPALQQKMLLSATDALEIPDFLAFYDYHFINHLPEIKQIVDGLAVQYLRAENDDKIEALFGLMCQHGARSTIVFCNHREDVEQVSAVLKQRGIYNEFYHGAMDQRERETALCKFRNGSTYVLVTTDLAARGLDIPNIRYIVHYHLPHTEEIFTHRNGRTARMDASGTAVLLLNGKEYLPEYVKEVAEEITVSMEAPLPERPKWSTIYISAGKKDKINKIDIVGFLSHQGQLKKEDIGLVEVKDYSAFVAIRKSKLGAAMRLVEGQRIKNKKVKIDIAK